MSFDVKLNYADLRSMPLMSEETENFLRGIDNPNLKIFTKKLIPSSFHFQVNFVEWLENRNFSKDLAVCLLVTALFVAIVCATIFGSYSFFIHYGLNASELTQLLICFAISATTTPALLFSLIPLHLMSKLCSSYKFEKKKLLSQINELKENYKNYPKTFKEPVSVSLKLIDIKHFKNINENNLIEKALRELDLIGQFLEKIDFEKQSN